MSQKCSGLNKVKGHVDLGLEVSRQMARMNLTAEETGQVKAEGLDRLIPRILSLFNPNMKGPLLDVGCGYGTVACVIQRVLNMETFGLDCEKHLLEQAKRKGVKTFCLNLETDKFPFENQTFTHITFIEVLEHLAKPEHCLSEIARVLTPDGALILTTPNLTSLLNRWLVLRGLDPVKGTPFERPCDRHIRLYARNSLTSLLSNWFTVNELIYFEPYARHSWKGSVRDTLHIFKKDLAYTMIARCQRRV